MKLRTGICWVTVLILLAACSEQESVAPAPSEREKACFSDLNAMSMQRTTDESAQFDAVMEAEDSVALTEFMESRQVRAAEFDLEYCRAYSTCFDGLTDQQRSDVVVRCTKRLLRERVTDNF